MDNESLEFLGDALLGFVVADWLFQQYPHFDEGQKSKIKATVSRRSRWRGTRRPSALATT